MGKQMHRDGLSRAQQFLTVECLGRIYEGNWKDGRRAGYGHLTQKDGSHYFGQYKDNQKHDVSGYALYIKATGSKWFTKYDSGKLVESQVINTDEWVENTE